MTHTSLFYGTEMGSIIYPYLYCGLVSAFNNKATFTLISFISGMTVNGHDTSPSVCQPANVDRNYHGSPSSEDIH
jgi:hypothetical protein